MAPPSLQPRPPIYIKSLLSTWPSDLKHHSKFVQEIFFTDRRVLVLLDDLSLKSSHSIFFNTLKSHGFDLDFKLADDSKIALQRYDQYLYDGLIIFAPSSERFGGSLDSKPIADFIDSGRNLILSADTSASDLIRGIATECGVDFAEDSSAMVIDHTSFSVSDAKGDHTLVDADDLVKSMLFWEKPSLRLLYSSQGLRIR